MTINDRFEAIICDLYGGNNAAFAKAIGVAPTVIQNVIGKRKGKPSFDVLAKVCALANINAEWVMTGHGRMLKSSSSSPTASKLANVTPLEEILISRVQKQAEEIGRLKAKIEQLESLAKAPKATKTTAYAPCVPGYSRFKDHNEAPVHVAAEPEP